MPCQTTSRTSCNLRVKSNTCFCCDLYNCGKWVHWAVKRLTELWIDGLLALLSCLDCFDFLMWTALPFFFFALQLQWLYYSKNAYLILTFVSENILLWDFRIKMFWKSLGNHPWFGSRSLFSRTISAIDDQFMMFFFSPFFPLIKPVWLCKISTSYLTELYFWFAISLCVSLHVFHCARNTNTNGLLLMLRKVA